MPPRIPISLRCSLVAAAILVAAAVAWTPRLLAQGSAPAQPGWATGGTPSDPASQIVADEKYAHADCAANTLLLFRVRGSGEHAGSDKLGAWTFAAGQAAIKKGWRVRDMQGDYPAPNLPALTVNVARDAVALKRYRDVATNSWPSMKVTLTDAYNRCPQRKMLIAGYSQGALIMRYLIRNLPASVRAQVAQVDLLGDPTADTKVDANLQHPANVGGRLTDGVDTKAARITHLGFFEQTAYPADIAPRTFQYCLPNDWVCDFNPVSILRAGRKAHEHYDWASIGRRAAGVLKTWNTSSTGGTTTTTNSSSPDAWPTHRNDGPSALFIWLGASFIFPSWSSCTAVYCLVGDDADQRVLVFKVQGGINELGWVAENQDPRTALANAGFSAADVDALLSPNG